MMKKEKRHRSLILFALLAVMALSGCSSKIQQPTVKVYWPPPPATPKMEWITTFSTEDNFLKSERQITAEKLLGKKDIKRFMKPVAAAVDADGLLYVADYDIGNIMVVDFAARKMSQYSEEVIGLPLDLKFDSKGMLYISDGYGKQVLVYNRQRQPVRSIGKGDLGRPNFIEINEELGRLYVSDVLDNRVVVFDLASGEKLFEFGERGNGEGEMHGPQGLAFDKEGRLFLAEQFGARVQVFDADGNFLYTFGTRGDQAFQFEGPRGLDFDSQGNLFIAEARKASVLLFTPEGAPLTSLGTGGTSFHQLGFTLPSSVYLDANDRIYVSDGMNKRVTIWQMLTPQYLAEHPVDQDALKKLEEKVIRLGEEREKQ